MDTLTHGIAGSVFGRLVTDRPGARAAMLMGLISAMWPDLDFLFLSDRLDYLRNHRGWSHSFVYLPLFALGLALLTKLLFRRASLARLWLFCAVGILSHILFDWITSFGTMFWIPFSRARHSLDWVFILDPFFTGIVAATLVATALFRARGRSIAIGGAALLCGYLAICALLHSKALAVWKRLDGVPPGAQVAVLPQFLSPFRWLGLTEHAREVHAAFFDVGPFARGIENPRTPNRVSEILSSLSDFYPPPERARIRRFAKPPESAALARVRGMSDVQVYLAFARFPLVTVTRGPDGGTIVTWEDLRFLPWFAGPWGRDREARHGFRRQPFVYQVRLDPSGQPIESSFVSSTLVR